jgi:hypothetical protein
MVAQKSKVNMVKDKEITMVEVCLIGEDSELVGNHTVHIGKLVDFVDGKANVPSNIADELRNLGMVK